MLEIVGEEIPVKNWKEVSSEFVRWLVEKEHITDRRLPILNSAGRDKYFVNSEPDHMDSRKDKDGFMKVSSGIYVDIKYNASAHVKNLVSTLDQLGLNHLKNKVKIRFAIEAQSLTLNTEEEVHGSITVQRPSNPRTPILNDFTAQLKEVARVRGFSAERWRQANPSSANPIEVNGPDYGKIYYVKTSKEHSVGGFWGLRTERIKALSENGKPWLVILLVGPREKSYLLTDKEVEKAENSTRWSCDIEGAEYKIKERYDLKGFRNFNSYEDLFEELLICQETDERQESTQVQLNGTDNARISINRQGVVDHTSQLFSLSSAVERDLRKCKPIGLEIEGVVISVRDWTDLCEGFVQWLVDKGYLTSKRLPILNHYGRDKFFINTKPEHLDSNKDGAWHEVAGFHVDTKYSTKGHMKNLLAALKHLELENLNVKIEFPYYA